MRFVSQQVNDCLGNEVPVQANFGLVFNKWLAYRLSKGKLELEVAQDRSRLVLAAGKAKTAAESILKLHHIRQAEYCLAMEKVGWKVFIFHARLIAPFVSGLGAAHSTETGLVLDHTSGMPYIPAAGQKGVLRIAHLINSLKDDDGWLSEEDLQKQGIVDGDMNWVEDIASKTLFGTGGNIGAQAGQLTILDAYPITVPELREDILNPHYKDYYEGNRGPTEDQSPIPIKFLTVKPGAEFVFRLLLRLSFTTQPGEQQEKLIAIIKKNIQGALTEAGVGAKTALGFGKFFLVGAEEPDRIKTWIAENNQRKQPWLSFIRKIETIEGWGQFKQIILDVDIDSDWQKKLEVGAAVKTAAIKARQKNRKKWDADRDQAVADWLEISGVAWEKLNTPDPAAEENPQLEQIKAMKTRTDYDRDLDIAGLDLACCQVLVPLFKSWKWDKKKRAKANSHRLWQALQGRIRQLKE